MIRTLKDWKDAIRMDYRLYILMRSDLFSMNPGRAMAQASHASNAFIHEYGKLKLVKKWQKQTDQGFGTAIVLAADLQTITNIFSRLKELKYETMGTVLDPDYVIPIPADIMPFLSDETQRTHTFDPIDDGKRYLFHREEITCAYIFGDKNQLSPFLGELPLHP